MIILHEASASSVHGCGEAAPGVERDLAIPAELTRFMSERASAHLVELDASHAVTGSQPGAVTELILEAARATAPVLETARTTAS